MVTLSRDKWGAFEAQFTWPDGSAVSIPLGRLSERQAENVRYYVERLIVSSETAAIPSPVTTEWIARAPEELRKHLEWLGLVEVANRRRIPTLAEWLQEYIDSRSDVRPATRVLYRKTERYLLRFFGGEIRIDRITPADAKGFHIWMKTTRGLSDATACLHCHKAKQFFRAAAKRRLIIENPFAGLRLGRATNPRRLCFVTREEAEAVLKIFPTAEWRLIFALCRYGGLRCPSEVTRLRWEDVDWARKRFTVHGPKTERYRDGGVRQVPIFPELLPHLQALLKQAKKGAEYVITRYRRPDQNLGTYLRSIVLRAGLKPWPRLTRNLRSTRETELAEDYPLHVVAAWMGHTRRIATKHYLQATESHYEKAAADTRPSPSEPKAPPTLPEDLADAWADLPEHVKAAILTLASTASHPGC